MTKQSQIVGRSCAPDTTIINGVPNPTITAPSNKYPMGVTVNTEPGIETRATMSSAKFPEYVLPSGNTL